jgi:hypothetical protein
MGKQASEIAPDAATLWAAQDMPWRRETEIDDERKRFLAGKRATPADEEKNRFPYSGVTLTRADVEWLLATHGSGEWLDQSIGTIQRSAREKDSISAARY